MESLDAALCQAVILSSDLRALVQKGCEGFVQGLT